MPDDLEIGGALTLVPTQVPAHVTPDNERLIAAAEKLVAEAICARINAKLGGQTTFSEPLRELLHRAWSLAAFMRHMDVRIDHVVAAFTTSDTALIDGFNGLLGDRVVPLAGAMIRLSGQRAVVTPPKITALLPHQALEGWFREAGRLAIARGSASVDLATDFFGILDDPNADPATRLVIRDALDRTLLAERAPAQLDRVRRDIDSIRITAGHHRANILNGMNQLAGTVTQSLSGTVAEFKSVAEELAASHEEANARAKDTADRQQAVATASMVTFTESMRGSLADACREIRTATAEAVGKSETAVASLSSVVEAADATMRAERDAIAADLNRFKADIGVPPLSIPKLAAAVVGTLVVGLAVGAAIFSAPRMLSPLEAESGHSQHDARADKNR